MNVKKPSSVPWIITVCGLGLADLVPVVPLVRERLRSGHAPVVHPTGRSDASQVLDPVRFRDPAQKRAYAIARQIPGTLNQLYCWCGCKEHSGHRAPLECFESEHASQCNICMGEAVIALTWCGAVSPTSGRSRTPSMHHLLPDDAET